MREERGVGEGYAGLLVEIGRLAASILASMRPHRGSRWSAAKALSDAASQAAVAPSVASRWSSASAVSEPPDWAWACRDMGGSARRSILTAVPGAGFAGC